MESPPKVHRVASSESPGSSSLLLGHLPVIRAPLFPFLTEGDFIALRWSCPTLREDEEVARRALFALYAMNKHAKCFFRGCGNDWCAAVPAFNFEDFQYCGGADMTNTDRSIDEIMRAWETELGSRERCESLLSLAWLMATELKPQLYSTHHTGVTSLTVIPFILPLSRAEEIARTHPAPGPATAVGCHIGNFMEGTGGAEDDVTCAFCTAIESAEKEAEEYREQRRDEDYGEQNVTDELYDEDNIHDNLGTILASWSSEGKIPTLKLVDSRDEEELYKAVRDGFYEEINRDDDGYCKSHLRPLAAFFRRNGFGPIHRATLEEDQFETDIFEDEIASIEMVGAAAPHGFFAGVYILSRSC